MLLFLCGTWFDLCGRSIFGLLPVCATFYAVPYFRCLCGDSSLAMGRRCPYLYVGWSLIFLFMFRCSGCVPFAPAGLCRLSGCLIVAAPPPPCAELPVPFPICHIIVFTGRRPTPPPPLVFGDGPARQKGEESRSTQQITAKQKGTTSLPMQCGDKPGMATSSRPHYKVFAQLLSTQEHLCNLLISDTSYLTTSKYYILHQSLIVLPSLKC